jgi:hypothetical protein
MTLQKLALMLATMMLLPACSNRSEDVATALSTQFGIGPVAEEENHLPQIRNDLRRIRETIFLQRFSYLLG